LNPIAHLRCIDGSETTEHLLSEHLQRVAIIAGQFASEFENSDWAESAGIWHDLGKYNPSWQAYIRYNNGVCVPEDSDEQD